MYKIPEEVIKFIKETMKNWKMEMAAGRKTLAEVEFQWSILPGDGLSSLRFTKATISLKILRKSSVWGL